MPNPFWCGWGEYDSLVNKLRRDGVLILPEMFPVSMEVRNAVSQLTYLDKQKYWVNTDPCSIHPSVSVFAADGHLLSIVADYFHRKPFLSEGDYRKVLPLDLKAHEQIDPKFKQGYSSSHWHYDLRARSLKVMIYLTDVGEDDQNFAYCKGTQHGFRSMKYEKSRFTDEQMKDADVLECYGKAGTVIIFDPNGIHRLRRKPTRARETITLNYHPGQMYRAKKMTPHPECEAWVKERIRSMSV